MAAPTNLRILVLDLPATVRFVHSVALAQAMAETTRLQWKTYDSTAVSLAYAVMFWKEKPGWVEVDTGTTEQVKRRTQELRQFHWNHLAHRLSEGPAAVARTLSAYNEIRRNSLEAVRQRFAEAKGINDEAARMTQRALVAVATAKFVADVATSLPGLGNVVGLPYNIAIEVIHSLQNAESANVLLLKLESKVASDTFEENVTELSDAIADEYKRAMENARVDIARQNDLLRRRAATAKSIRKAAQRLESATSARTAAQAGRVAFAGVAWGFAAANIHEAWTDYAEAIGL